MVVNLDIGLPNYLAGDTEVLTGRVLTSMIRGWMIQCFLPAIRAGTGSPRPATASVRYRRPLDTAGFVPCSYGLPGRP